MWPRTPAASAVPLTGGPVSGAGPHRPGRVPSGHSLQLGADCKVAHPDSIAGSEPRWPRLSDQPRARCAHQAPIRGDRGNATPRRLTLIPLKGPYSNAKLHPIGAPRTLLRSLPQLRTSGKSTMCTVNLSQGAGTKQMALSLSISEPTVKSHLSNI